MGCGERREQVRGSSVLSVSSVLGRAGAAADGVDSTTDRTTSFVMEGGTGETESTFLTLVSSTGHRWWLEVRVVGHWY